MNNDNIPPQSPEDIAEYIEQQFGGEELLYGEWQEIKNNLIQYIKAYETNSVKINTEFCAVTAWMTGMRHGTENVIARDFGSLIAQEIRKAQPITLISSTTP